MGISIESDILGISARLGYLMARTPRGERPMSEDFTHATLGKMGKRVCRLGLSASYRPGKAVVHRALDAGINLFFGYGFDGQLTKVVRELSADQRDRLVLVTGGYNLIVNRRPDLQKVLEKRLRQLRTDYLDAFLWLGVTKPTHLNDYILEALHRLRDDGKVRAVGISCHHRELIGQLAEEGALDVFMLRYNAAHRGAESEIFPFVEAHDPDLISYTATRWKKLLSRPKGWPKDGRIPTASQCYRFVLSDPHVDVVLTAPSKAKQFDENLKSLDDGPLDDAEMAFMREFGDVVHDQKKWFM
jgi:aryl-alcohol dehydrogenase-like predicted oxidoreductase